MHWASLTLATSIIGLLLRERCRGDALSASASDYAKGCYSDIVPLYIARGLSDGIVPYSEPHGGRYFEYPALTGAFARLVQVMVQGIENPTEREVMYFRVTVLALVLCAVGTVYLLARMMPDQPWVPATVALSPLLLFELAINWDLLAVLSAVLAMYAWQRERVIQAGVWAGIGIAFKLWPLFVLAALMIDALRRGWVDRTIRVGAAGTATWILVNAPTLLAYPEGWAEFYRFSAARENDWGSLWTGLMYIFDWRAPTQLQNLLGIGGMLVGTVVVARYAKSRNASMPLVALSLLTVFLTIGKVYSPQYSLWLLPFVALCIRDLRVHVLWQGVQFVYFAAVMGALLNAATNGSQGLGSVPYGWSVLLLHASNLTVLAWAWREHSSSVQVRTVQQ